MYVRVREMVVDGSLKRDGNAYDTRALCVSGNLSTAKVGNKNSRRRRFSDASEGDGNRCACLLERVNERNETKRDDGVK